MSDPPLTPTASEAPVVPGRDVALCRSLLYEALALGFRDPDDRTVERLAREDAAGALAEAAAILDAARGTGLAPLVRGLARSPEGTSLDALRASHRRLFGHTARGPIPPYETEYGEDTLFQKPQELGDIAAFLRAFGLAPAPGARERLDHVSCELEFLAFLARKEAHALERGDAEMEARTLHATRLFLKDHLGRFAASFARRLRAADRGGFHGTLAEILAVFVKDEGVRVGAPVGPEALRLRAPVDDRAPIACGGTDGCAPGPCGPDAAP